MGDYNATYGMTEEAAAICRSVGLRAAHCKSVMLEVQERNPALLIGGYHIDAAIMGIWVSLQMESVERVVLTDDEIYDRITECLSVMYAGLI